MRRDGGTGQTRMGDEHKLQGAAVSLAVKLMQGGRGRSHAGVRPHDLPFGTVFVFHHISSNSGHFLSGFLDPRCV